MSHDEGDEFEVHDVGPHRLVIEPPDIVHVHYVGNVTLEQFMVFDELIQGLPPGRRIYLLRDGRLGGLASPQARKFMVRSGHIPRLIAVITYGAGFQARTFVSMANKAVRVLTKQAMDLTFVDTEAEARAWIAEHRKRAHEGQGSSSKL